MSHDHHRLHRLRRRRQIMIGVCAVAGLVAVVSMALYLRGAAWGVAGFVLALAAGFGAQIWFIAGLRRHKGGS